MLDPKELELEQAVHDLIIDLCEVMYNHGYSEVSIGALMRVIGVANERARDHDAHVIDLLEHFAKDRTSADPIPPGTVLH